MSVLVSQIINEYVPYSTILCFSRMYFQTWAKMTFDILLASHISSVLILSLWFVFYFPRSMLIHLVPLWIQYWESEQILTTCLLFVSSMILQESYFISTLASLQKSYFTSPLTST